MLLVEITKVVDLDSKNGKTGFVGDANPESLGSELDRWYETDDKGATMGSAGKSSIQDITWDRVVSVLTSSLRKED